MRRPSVAVSPDEKPQAPASEDKATHVWVWRPEDLIAQARSRLTRNLTYDGWQRYLPGQPYRKACPNFPAPTELHQSE